MTDHTDHIATRQRYLLDLIDMSRRSYEAAIKPYVDELVRLRCLSVQPLITTEMVAAAIMSQDVAAAAEAGTCPSCKHQTIELRDAGYGVHYRCCRDCGAVVWTNDMPRKLTS